MLFSLLLTTKLKNLKTFLCHLLFAKLTILICFPVNLLQDTQLKRLTYLVVKVQSPIKGIPQLNKEKKKNTHNLCT